VTKPNLLKIEKDLIKEFEQLSIKKMSELKNPECIYFTSWTFTQPESKLIDAWKKEQNKDLVKDAVRSRLGRIWSFIFPEFREDYLVERTWNWMHKYQISNHSMLILPFPPAAMDSIWAVHLKEDFKNKLKGNSLREKIEKQYQNLYKDYKDINDINEVDLHLKTARLLRYNKDFNNVQIGGIDEAFSFWVNNKDDTITENLNFLFKNLYNKKDPAHYSFEARKFLTIWQNFSVLFPEFPYIIVYFSIPDLSKNPEIRYAVALCFKNLDNKLRPVLTSLEEIIENTHKSFQSDLISYLKKGTSRNENIGETNWPRVKEEYKDVIKKVVGKNNLSDFDKLDRLVALVERLSFSTHEGRPCKFAFVAGTEQIWPSVEEIISLEEREFDLELFAKRCEANYSIFQFEKIVGFFNTDLQSMYKIVKLRTPAREELRKTGDYINDLDDLFCWAIEKIYKETNLRSFFVFVQGDGRILFYGLPNSNNKADLLFIWDLRKGKLNVPVEKPEIKKELALIGIYEDDVRCGNIIKTIRKISASPGEGAALIIARQHFDVEKYLVTMEYSFPPWLRTLSLDDPQYLLKAAFILDGACLITPKRVNPRLAIYPHSKKEDEYRAFGILENLKKKAILKKEERCKILNLCGKGSKTHAACNLTNIPEIKNKCIVITVSADGPVHIWK